MASEERDQFYGSCTCLIEDMYRVRLILLKWEENSIV